MNIPLKPWEIAGSSSNFPVPLGSSTLANTDRLHSSAIPYPGSGGGGSVSQAPPVPPRPGQTRPIYSATSYNRPSMFPSSGLYGGSPYYNSSSYYGGGGYGAGSYGMASYGGYGGYGMGNRYGMYGGGVYGNNPMNPEGQPSFVQLAEESSANAFQSIESFVGAFGSISAMLESTFHAVYSSFRAVIGVADHMGRLKHFLSAMAVFRFLRWVARRFLYLIGVSKVKPEVVESLWSTLAGESLTEEIRDNWESELQSNAKGSSWPILMFLSFILAGPYLMWKLMSSLNLDHNPKVNKAWASGETDHFLAVAQYEFEGMADRELKVKAGQRIRLAPAASQPPNVKGWVLASDGVKIGLIPTNYIKILGKRAGRPNNTNDQDLNTIPHSTHPPPPGIPLHSTPYGESPVQYSSPFSPLPHQSNIMTDSQSSSSSTITSHSQVQSPEQEEKPSIIITSPEQIPDQ